MKNIYLSVLMLMVTTSATMFVVYEQYQSFSKRSVLNSIEEIKAFENKKVIEQYKTQIQALLENKIAEVPSSDKVDIVVINQRIENLDAKIDRVSEQTLGLRQAINPTKPDEILKIARLTDEVSSLKNELEDLESKLSSQQKAFQESILRELKSSNDSTTFMLVLLLPLIINFMYTVWRDIKNNGDNKEGKEEAVEQK
ncbi:hypothetical protein [Vibrio furnissii]|uniref:hypothetical protein n=1 Tax=Vibrio furnissii TaxID=29494 RepID=UPI001EE9C234|nr:hypothetical protein [Vibrio furnissii]MCG6231758.1 hypothetical protein [Vibrio furnissii]MCG6257378.1 hypothetical protein [Vibrio furnissii]